MAQQASPNLITTALSPVQYRFFQRHEVIQLAPEAIQLPRSHYKFHTQAFHAGYQYCRKFVNMRLTPLALRTLLDFLKRKPPKGIKLIKLQNGQVDHFTDAYKAGARVRVPSSRPPTHRSAAVQRQAPTVARKRSRSVSRPQKPPAKKRRQITVAPAPAPAPRKRVLPRKQFSMAPQKGPRTPHMSALIPRKMPRKDLSVFSRGSGASPLLVAPIHHGGVFVRHPLM